MEERRLGEVHLTGDVLHPRIFAILREEADPGRIAREGPIGECVDMKKRSPHERLVVHPAAATKSHLPESGLGRRKSQSRERSKEESDLGRSSLPDLSGS